MKHLIILISILLLSSPVIGDYQTNGNKIRLRYLSGSNEHTRTSPAMDGSSKIDVKTFSLFYGEWGLTKSKLHHKGYWHEKDGTKILGPTEDEGGEKQEEKKALSSIFFFSVACPCLFKNVTDNGSSIFNLLEVNLDIQNRCNKGSDACYLLIPITRN